MAEFTVGTGSLAVSGDVDVATVDAFIARAEEAFAGADGALVIDVGGVTFIDSSGLGALVRIHKSAQEKGLGMRLVNVPTAVSRIFDLTGLGSLFFPDEE